MTPAMRRLGLAIVAATVSVGMPAGGGIARAQAPAVSTVRASADLKFHPARTVIAVNGTVTWLNIGFRGHRVLSWDGKHATGATSINGGVVLDGYLEDKAGQDKFAFTFEKPGTYPYYCNVDDHYLSGMTGEIVVLAVGQRTAPPVRVDGAAQSPEPGEHATTEAAAEEAEHPGANIPVIAGLLIGALLGIYAFAMALRRPEGGSTAP